MTPWFYGSVAIIYSDGRVHDVVGLIAGDLAVHPAQRACGGVEWRITHVRTGMRILRYAWWDDAMESAEQLVLLPWSFDKPEEAPESLKRTVQHIHLQQLLISESRKVRSSEMLGEQPS